MWGHRLSETYCCSDDQKSALETFLGRLVDVNSDFINLNSNIPKYVKCSIGIIQHHFGNTETYTWGIFYTQIIAKWLFLFTLPSCLFWCFFFSDSEVDFLPISQEDNRIHISGDSFEIPCRVNNPNTTVTLKLCYREQDNCQSTVLDRYNQSYEPKRGRRP